MRKYKHVHVTQLYTSGIFGKANTHRNGLGHGVAVLPGDGLALGLVLGLVLGLGLGAALLLVGSRALLRDHRVILNAAGFERIQQTSL